MANGCATDVKALDLDQFYGGWDHFSMVRNAKSTTGQWNAYQQAWSWFDDQLFDGEQEPCILNFSRRSKRTNGFFAPDKWSKQALAVPEISLNPDQLKRPLAAVMSTLAHEMAHQWQFQCGNPSRNGYHNREWSDKMKEIGLHSSNTGQPGGRETGQQVTHYVIEGGLFEKAFHDMPEEYSIPWTSGAAEAKPVPRKCESKVKFTCPSCAAKAWGKPGLLIKCKPCDLEMVNGVKVNLPDPVVRPPVPVPSSFVDDRPRTCRP
jgi:hypothetical protein